MTEPKYKPSEEAIEKLVSTQSPRALATAYLRAKRRADDAEVHFKLLTSLVESGYAVRDGDLEKARDALKSGLKSMRTYNQTTEGS